MCSVDVWMCGWCVWVYVTCYPTLSQSMPCTKKAKKSGRLNTSEKQRGAREDASEREKVAPTLAIAHSRTRTWPGRQVQGDFRQHPQAKEVLLRGWVGGQVIKGELGAGALAVMHVRVRAGESGAAFAWS